MDQDAVSFFNIIIDLQLKTFYFYLFLIASDTHAVAAKVRLRQLILSESHDHSEETGSTGRRSSIEDAGTTAHIIQ